MSECLSPFIALTQYNVPRHSLQLYSCMYNLHTCDSEVLTKMISLVMHPYLISIIVWLYIRTAGHMHKVVDVHTPFK